MLGSSENLGGFAEHFGLVDKKDKIYQKRKTTARLTTYFANTDYLPGRRADARLARDLPAPFTMEREVEHLLVNRFIPVSIVVNDQLEIVQFHGKTGAYLEPPAGQPSFSLAKMAREGLLVDLRSALDIARKTNGTVRKEGLHVRSEGGTRQVNLEVLPLRGPSAHERLYVVVFEEPVPKPAVLERKSTGRKTVKAGRSTPRETELLRRETDQLRQQLRSLICEHETTVEEFKAAHEEVLSANEELQSTNEEMETSKEELQSTNEELTTLNEEMQNRNAELGTANNDLLNLLGHVDIPVVMVSNDLRIRRFTPAAQKLLNLLPGDIGRRLGEIRPNLEVEDLEGLVREAIRAATAQERQVRTTEGEWQMLHVRPYRTWDNRIEGAVISLQDVNALKRSLDQTREYADTIVESAREPILVLDARLQVTAANPAFYRVFNAAAAETEGRLIYELGNGQWNNARLRELLEEIIPQNSRVDDFEMTHEFPHIGSREMQLNARRVELQPGHPFILLAIEDVTEKNGEGAA
jgi:two-component system CheB/CheR fusion protein